MSRSEFRWNKKRKHYAYIFGDKGDYRKNILISSEPVIIDKNKGRTRVIKNIKLYKNPNNSCEQLFIIKKAHLDHKNAFSDKTYPWKFSVFDKRIIKRIKRKYKFRKK